MNIHGGDIYPYLQQQGRAPLDFSANINPLGLPEGVSAAVRESLSLCANYPDIHCSLLRKAVSAWEGTGPDTLLFGCGAAELIFRAVWGTKPKEALLLSPSFHEYRAALESFGCPIQTYSLNPQKNFQLDEGILEHLPQDGMVFLCSPNNPTGALIAVDLLQRIALCCEKLNSILVIDECFMDFVEDKQSFSFKPFLIQHKNTVILRAFTKIFAMAGLRLGYCICENPQLLKKLEAAGPPWSVSVPAQAAGIAACKEEEYLKSSVKLVHRERLRLTQALEALGFKVFPGKANYILFQVPKNSPPLIEFLQEQGILIRSCGNYTGLDSSYYRTAVKLPEENQRLIGGLTQWQNQL